MGERLQGHDRMMQAPIVPKVLHDERCTIICKKKLSRRDVAKLQRLVRQDYAVHMSLDGLPVYIQDEESGMASRGYPIGSKMTDDMYFLYNHLRFTIEVNNSDVDNQGSHRIVGFSVVNPFHSLKLGKAISPFSIAHNFSLQNSSQLDPCQFDRQQNK